MTARAIVRERSIFWAGAPILRFEIREHYIEGIIKGCRNVHPSEVTAGDAGSGQDSNGILSLVTACPSRPQVGVGVVFLRGDRVFLAKRQGAHGEDTWASAGGHLEMGESLEECARREAMEELSVDVRSLRFLCVSNIVAYGKHYVDIEFLGDIDKI